MTHIDISDIIQVLPETTTSVVVCRDWRYARWNMVAVTPPQGSYGFREYKALRGFGDEYEARRTELLVNQHLAAVKKLVS